MPQFSTKRRVAHSAADMFNLVADVEHYPEFVPLCRSLQVRQRTDAGEGRDVIVADMTVAYKLIHETFTSRVTLDRAKLEILVEYLKARFAKSITGGVFGQWGRTPATSNFSSLTSFAAAPSGFSWGRRSKPRSAAFRQPSNAAPIRSMGSNQVSRSLRLNYPDRLVGKTVEFAVRNAHNLRHEFEIPGDE